MLLFADIGMGAKYGSLPAFMHGFSMLNKRSIHDNGFPADPYDKWKRIFI